MLKALLSNKEKLQELANIPFNENCSAVILKKLPEKLGDPGKFLFLCGFSLPELISTRMTLELANCAICTPVGIARDVFVLVGKFTFPADVVIVDYESDPRVPLILGRPFLRTARALIYVHGEEMILRDRDERLTLNMRHDTSSYSNQPQKESINLINVFNNSSEEFFEDLFSNQPSGNPTFLSHPELTSSKVKNDIIDSEGCNVLYEKLLDFDSTKDLHPPLHDNPLSGKIEFLLYQDKDSSLKDSIDQKNLANLADIFVDSIPEIFTDEHALDYSSPSIFDEYDDDFLEVESDAENVYDDPFDSKGEKIKESKLLIDELDLPCDFLPPSEYDSFISQDFFTVDALPSTKNEDKITILHFLSFNRESWNRYDKNETKSEQNRTKSRANGKRESPESGPTKSKPIKASNPIGPEEQDIKSMVRINFDEKPRQSKVSMTFVGLLTKQAQEAQATVEIQV
nr:hypothetical protein [Tanacetum cinerariifolium]